MPPQSPPEVALWSDVHLYGMVALGVVVRKILPDGRRHGRLYRAGSCAVALKRCDHREIGLPLERGAWIDLRTGECGSNPLDLYARVHRRSYRDAVLAIGAEAGLIGPGREVSRLVEVRRWRQERHPLHPEGAAFLPPWGYPVGSEYLTYFNTAGHAVAQVIRYPGMDGGVLDAYRSIWRHCQGAESQWIETFPQSPYPIFNAHDVFRRADCDVILVEDEFVARDLAFRHSTHVFSAVPGGLRNLPQADLRGLRNRRVRIVLRQNDLCAGLQIHDALRQAGVDDPWFSLDHHGPARRFADMAEVAAAEGIELLPCPAAASPSESVVVWAAGGPVPDGDVERQWILDPIVREGDLVWIYAEPKIGKTWLALALSLAASVGGGQVGPWTAVEPVGVLHVDGEMQAPDLNRAITMVMAGAGNRPSAPTFAVLCAKSQPDGIIDLTDDVWQHEVEKLLSGRKVLILDNFQSLTDNGPGALKLILPWLRRLTRAGIAVIIMDHTNRDGELQGSYGKARIADLSIAMRHASDADKAAGIISIEFPAARRLHGADADPFRMQRVFTDDSFAFHLLANPLSSLPPLSPQTLQRLCEMARVVVARERGLTFLQIRDRLGIPASTACGHMKAARNLPGPEREALEDECRRLRVEPDGSSSS
jgi:hypothetical protein